MIHLTVELDERSYPILIGPGLLGDAKAWRFALGARSIVVTSQAVGGLHLPGLRAALGDHPHEVVILPDGEEAKSLAYLEQVITAAIEAGVGRDGTFIALGGGAIGDVTGFAAACYHRGVGLVQVPTTLLAQVDSSVGGKTAVNHPLGKNLMGAFHQPRCVIADLDTLRTLPRREFASGLAEVAKYALLESGDLFAWLESRVMDLLAQDADVLAETVRRCCAAKAAFVSADETEQGRRALLNLGHTFGHALETAYEGGLTHGEAVALGCRMAVHLSRSLGWLVPAVSTRMLDLLNKLGLPDQLPTPKPDADRLLALMARDKKALAGHMRLVLLRGLGDAVLTADYPQAALILTLREFTGEAG